MRKLLLASATCALCLPLPAGAQQCLGFGTALTETLSRDPRIDGAEASREQALAGALASYSQNLPQVSLFGQAGLGNTLPLDRTRDDQVGVQVTQDLFTFGQRSASQAAAKAQLEAARHGVDQTRIDVAEGVALAYIDVLRAQRILQLTEEQAESYGRDADAAAERLSRQVITLTDAAQIRARYAVARSDTLNARVEADGALVRLSVLTGREVPCVEGESATGMLDRQAEETLALSPVAATDRAMDRSFALRQARSTVRAATARLDEARRAHLPTISANAFALYQDDPGFGQDQQEARIGFALRQDLYTGGRNRARSLDARARLRGAKADEDLQRLIVEDAVRRALSEAQVTLNVGETLLEASVDARTQLRATEIEYERGTKTLTDLVLANETYYGAVRQETNARFAYYSALVRLYAAMGILVDPVIE
ncbi:TolC family protein [Parvularcula dongshanensis]|uniref:Outer membrane protein TolC n=1 Tax=Parvularcula dongshanensis TaxID=1173995 RepID=A0A840I3A1_9PROT|nr:TolC family protein [Parvularcula dongshanensis]MBB4658684.1 outer membrane protein TolC [Parvularcula dongshanensis]